MNEPLAAFFLAVRPRNFVVNQKNNAIYSGALLYSPRLVFEWRDSCFF